MPEGIPLGPYVLLRRLARGGMAEIFLARKEGPQGFARDLVVKRVLPHLSEADEFQRMFHEEARIVARLTHPNVVQVYDFGEVGGTPYLVMELVRGVDLRALIDRARAVAEAHGVPGALPVHHAVKILSAVCEGLAHAHALKDEAGRELGLVHRDVTPSNVLISFDGAVKVADFGIAKLDRQKSRDETQAGKVRGKYAYLSPEQSRGQALDQRSDVFNVGSLLFEAILGESLYPHDDAEGARLLAAAGKIPEPERIQRTPPGLWRILQRALAPRREERYPDALSLRADLEAFLRSGAEPSDQLEIGRYVRSLFPDVVAEDQRAPRAAGTVPLTGAKDMATLELPAPTFEQAAADPPPRVQTPALAPTPSSEAPRRRLWWIPIALSLVLLGALSFVLWPSQQLPDAPPEPTTTPLPPARSEAPAAPATLRIATAPAGLEVTIDGEARGPAPLVVDLTPGAHVVVARDPERGLDLRAEVVLQPGDEREVRLEAPPESRLAVASTPSGAQVRLDGDLVGRTPLDLEVPPGRHGVRIELDGHMAHEAEVDARAGSTSSLAIVLQAAPPSMGARMSPRMASMRAAPPGTLSIATSPWCEVWWRGRKLGTTPLANVRLPAGRQTLELRRPGQPAVRRTVTIRSGEETRARYSL